MSGAVFLPHGVAEAAPPVDAPGTTSACPTGGPAADGPAGTTTSAAAGREDREPGGDSGDEKSDGKDSDGEARGSDDQDADDEKSDSEESDDEDGDGKARDSDEEDSDDEDADDRPGADADDEDSEEDSDEDSDAGEDSGEEKRSDEGRTNDSDGGEGSGGAGRTGASAPGPPGPVAPAGSATATAPVPATITPAEPAATPGAAAPSTAGPDTRPTGDPTEATGTTVTTGPSASTASPASPAASTTPSPGPGPTTTPSASPGTTTSATASASATTSRAAGPADSPGDVLDLGPWYLTLPSGQPGKPDTVENPDLATFTNDFFKLNPDGNGVAFSANGDGATTKNSHYPRSELREMNGSEKAAWSNTTGTHTLEVCEAFTKLPAAKPEVVGVQIHDGDDDVLQVRLEGERLVVQYDDGKSEALLDPSYQLGTPYRVRIVAADSKVNVLYNGEQKAELPLSGSGWYWKVGAYVQSNASKGDGAGSIGEVVVYSIDMVHS